MCRVPLSALLCCPSSHGIKWWGVGWCAFLFSISYFAATFSQIKYRKQKKTKTKQNKTNIPVLPLPQRISKYLYEYKVKQSNEHHLPSITPLVSKKTEPLLAFDLVNKAHPPIFYIRRFPFFDTNICDLLLVFQCVTPPVYVRWFFFVDYFFLLIVRSLSSQQRKEGEKNKTKQAKGKTHTPHQQQQQSHHTQPPPTPTPPISYVCRASCGEQQGDFRGGGGVTDTSSRRISHRIPPPPPPPLSSSFGTPSPTSLPISPPPTPNACPSALTLYSKKNNTNKQIVP